MTRRKVDVASDHIERLISASPLKAVEELIWNAFDAGGNRVEVILTLNDLGSADVVEVVDAGPGITPSELDRAFGAIGGSVKPENKVNPDGRAYHGREGKGRFKALALSPTAVWTTVYRSNGSLQTYSITLKRESPEYFDPTEPVAVQTGNTGTKVVLRGIDQGQNLFVGEGIREKLAETFAAYLRSYPGVELIWDGKVVKIDELVDRVKELVLFDSNHELGPATLLVVEWKSKLDAKRLHICDESGFSLRNFPAGVQGRGIEFTGYIHTARAPEWAATESLSIEELDGEIRRFLEAAKERLREYIRGRLAEEAQSVVQQWKDDAIYPYREEALDPIGQAEREVFDIVAVQINEQHPTFQKSDTESKKLTLALVKEALESNPTSLTKLLREIVALSDEDQAIFAELLERAPLTNLIRAGKMVADRLDVIHGFEHILFEENWKERLLERTQLHRLLVHEIWVLGEEHMVGGDDDGLRDVLKKHLSILGREDLAPDAEVKLIDGKDGIPDLMLYRRRKVDRDNYEHLVVELKRPSVPLGQDETSQIKKYAFTVAKDERFNTKTCKWEFWLLGNDIDEFVKGETTSDNLPEGCLYVGNGVRIWVRRWADVLADARSRYEFFQEQLQIEASQSKGLEVLKDRYPHLFEGKGKRKKKDLELSAERSRQQ